MHKRKPEPEETQRVEGVGDVGPECPPPTPDMEMHESPHWDMSTPDGLFERYQSGGPGCIYRQITITETTNDKEWMHRNMDLAQLGTSFNKRFDKLLSAAVLFAVGMVMMGGLIWILSWNG